MMPLTIEWKCRKDNFVGLELFTPISSRIIFTSLSSGVWLCPIIYYQKIHFFENKCIPFSLNLCDSYQPNSQFYQLWQSFPDCRLLLSGSYSKISVIAILLDAWWAIWVNTAWGIPSILLHDDVARWRMSGNMSLILWSNHMSAWWENFSCFELYLFLHFYTVLHWSLC